MLTIYVNGKTYDEVQGIHGLRGHLNVLGKGQTADHLANVVSELLKGSTVAVNGRQIHVKNADVEGV